MNATNSPAAGSPAGWPGSAPAAQGASPMSSSTTQPTQNEFQKIWGWIKKEITVVEADLAKIIGSDDAQKLEAIGKNLLDGFLGPLATAAIAEATDVATGKMSVSKAIEALIAMAEAEGKQLSQAAALQVIALAQNSLPRSNGKTVPP